MGLEIPRSRAEAVTHRSTWRWVLRRWWIPVFGFVLGGAGGLVWGVSQPTLYEADAVVIASRSDLPSEDFGGLAEAVFTTDTVLQPVIDRLGLDDTPQQLLSDGRLLGEAVAGSPALRITGRDTDPQRTAALVRAAADSFVAAASNRELGEFSVFGAERISSRELSSGRPWAVAGAVGGGLLGVILVLLFSSLRQPLLSEDEATAAFPAEFALTARVRPAGDRWAVSPRGVVRTIRRAVDATGGGDVAEGTVGGVLCVLVADSRRADRSLRVVASQVRRTPGAPTPLGFHRVVRGELLPLEGEPAPSDEPVAVLALVAEGTRRATLEDLDEVATGAAGPEHARVLVFVRKPTRASAVTAWLRRRPRSLENPGRNRKAIDYTPRHARRPEETALGAAEAAAAAEGLPRQVAAEEGEAEAAQGQTTEEPDRARAPNGQGPPPIVPAPEAESPPAQLLAANPYGDGGDEELLMARLRTPLGLDEVLRALSHPVANVRAQALATLLNRPDPSAVTAVTARLRDPEPRVRALALTVLTTIKEAQQGRQ